MNDNQATKTLTREELYDLVWRTPISHLAKGFGISNVGLAKVCMRHNIPTPSSGYWVKKANGKIVRRLSLPPCNDPKLESIKIDPVVQARRDDARDNPQPLASTFFDPEVGELAEREARNFEPIKISESLRSPHNLVKRTHEGLIAATKQRPYCNYLVLWPIRADDLCCLDIQVGKPSINRALRIMDALIKGLEKRGYVISVPTERSYRGLIVEALGEKLRFRLREPTVRSTRELTAEQRKYLESNPGARLYPEFNYSLSDKLQLEFLSGGNWPLTLRTWRDGKKKRIEDSLAEIPIAILRIIDHYRHRAVINAEEARQRAEIERLRHEEEERRRLEEQHRKEEEERMQALFTEAETWARCQQLRAYIAAVRNAAIERCGSVETGSDMGRRLAWAEQVADKCDPISRSCASETTGSNASNESDNPNKPR